MLPVGWENDDVSVGGFWGPTRTTKVHVGGTPGLITSSVPGFHCGSSYDFVGPVKEIGSFP